MFVFPIIGNHGPATLAKQYIQTIHLLSNNKYIVKYFNLTINNHVSFDFCKEYLNNTDRIIWFLFSNFFNKILLKKYNSVFKNAIYGPMVSPKKWFLFPINNTYEADWSNYISNILAYVVQSERVKNHLISRSRKLYNIEKKYIVSHGCLLPHKSYSILAWDKRNIDILIYAKFADINKEKDMQHLIKSFGTNYKLLLVRYGNHTKHSLIKDASNSKILIYYSYYDCWPSSLMEMLNLGIYPIVQQCEFIESYGTCIEDFYNNESRIINTVQRLLLEIYNSTDISISYRIRNNCLNVLTKTMNDIYFRKTRIKLY